jgi:formylglycine-generating enzyme required for sulfatase activity
MNPLSEKLFDVFISYSKHHKRVAQVICDKMEALRIRCCMAPRIIATGPEWTKAIFDGIDNSRAMVLVFNESANVSSQDCRELDRAIHQELVVVPFRIRNVLQTDLVSHDLGVLHGLDALGPPLEQQLGDLVDAIRNLLRPRESADERHEPDIEEPAAVLAEVAAHEQRRNVDSPLSPASPPVPKIFIRTPESRVAAAAAMPPENGLKMSFVWCPPGTFPMGSPRSHQGRSLDENQVTVQLTRGFWMGTYEVTQEEWERVMDSRPWQGEEYVTEGADYPATFVSWDDAMAFCKMLTQQERAASRLPNEWEYTLPTEAQWEYACRAGTHTSYSFGDDELALNEYAWWGGKSETGNVKTELFAHRVGARLPNSWGLHDMHGNVCEWCQDAFTEMLPGGENPVVRSGSSVRIFRGGSWLNGAANCRSAYRLGDSAIARYAFIGFRVACSMEPSPLEKRSRK